jgi:hypothetical protein
MQNSQHKNKKKHEKLKEDTKVAKIEIHKRQGIYRKGMNVDDPYGEILHPVDDGANMAKPPTKNKRTTTASQHCQFCGKKGHVTNRSKKCIHHSSVDAQVSHKRDGSLLVPATDGDTVSPAAVPVTLPYLAQLLQEATNPEDRCVTLHPAAFDDAADQELMDEFAVWEEDQEDDQQMYLGGSDSDSFHEPGTWSSDSESEDDELTGGII